MRKIKLFLAQLFNRKLTPYHWSQLYDDGLNEWVMNLKSPEMLEKLKNAETTGIIINLSSLKR